jgi:FKBP-type peptidyl-prolyl cis-trans isomerase FklB
MKGVTMKLKTTLAVVLGCVAVQAAATPATPTPAPTTSPTPATSATPSTSPAVTSAQPTTTTAATVSPLKNDNDRASYTIGVDMGKSLKAQNLQLNIDMLARGIKDGLAGSPLLMTDDEMRQTLLTLQKQIIAKQQADMKVLGDKNLQAGQKFLDDNKTKPGVKVTANGLQYKVIDDGKGKMPASSDVVTVDYEGKLINGQVFDSTYQRGKPATFQLSQVIEGWQQALQMMKAGATWELYIPPKLAYGDKGLGGPIGPNETLVFKVHLISVGAPAATDKKQS